MALTALNTVGWSKQKAPTVGAKKSNVHKQLVQYYGKVIFLCTRQGADKMIETKAKCPAASTQLFLSMRAVGLQTGATGQAKINYMHIYRLQ